MENQQARTLQNSENLVLSQNGVRKYFLAKLFVPHYQKKHFYNIIGSFWKFEFLTENWQADPYKKVQIWYYLKMG